MLPATDERVYQNTSDSSNEKIRRSTYESVAWYAAAGPAAIDRRLAELDREWDIERTLEFNAAMISLASVLLAVGKTRKWLLLTGAVATFLAQHALQGWCPPLPVFRLLGIRSSREIHDERMALKALRGDFRDLPVELPATGPKVNAALEAVRR